VLSQRDFHRIHGIFFIGDHSPTALISNANFATVERLDRTEDLTHAVIIKEDGLSLIGVEQHPGVELNNVRGLRRTIAVRDHGDLTLG
jgi:hypothetical protein